MIAEFEARWEADGFCFAAVERRADGALLGMAGIARVATSSADLSPASRSAGGWPRRTGATAMRPRRRGAWLDHGFGTLGLAEIVAFTGPGEPRARWR